MPSFPVLSTFIALMFLLVKHWRKSRPRPVLKKLPPGPPKLPLIGNLHQLIGELPPHHPVTILARKYGPVMRLQVGETSLVVISSAEAAKEVLKTKELSFAQRPVVFTIEITDYSRSIFFSPYGEYWRQVRKISVLELLSTMRVQSYRSIREEEVWDLVESLCLSEGVLVNLGQKLSYMTSCVILRAVFGKKCKDQDEFLSLLSEMIRVAGGLNWPDLYPSLRFLRHFSRVKPVLTRLRKKFDKMIDDIITEHKLQRKSAVGNSTANHEDIIDVLLNLQETNHQLEIRMTDNCIKAVIIDIFGAGTDTTGTTLEWAMAELIKRPAAMEQAQAEMRQVFKGKTKIHEEEIENLHYLKAVIKETLRLHPPSPLQPREARENSEIGGYFIHAKEMVFINAYAIGRDPNVWTEPNSFKPERFLQSPIDFRGTNFEYIPFGSGRRICPGISFANATIELALAQLLYHFNWTLTDGMKPEELDMNDVVGITARKKHNLHLVPTICVPHGG